MIRSFGSESEVNKKYIILLMIDDNSGGKFDGKARRN